VTEILTKEGFSLMAALICILGGLTKDDRVASCRFLESTLRRYGNSEKTLYGRYCTLIGPCHRTNKQCLGCAHTAYPTLCGKVVLTEQLHCINTWKRIFLQENVW